MASTSTLCQPKPCLHSLSGPRTCATWNSQNRLTHLRKLKGSLQRIQQKNGTATWKRLTNRSARIVAEQHKESPVVSAVPTDEPPPPFSWQSHWYGVHVARHMDVSCPHPVTILGRPYVLWRDVTGEWRCFLDECPHRLVPLSEGRIDESGRLQCSYHGWAFGPTGTCEHIPQEDESMTRGRMAASPRACARAVPAMEAQGIVFVWPDENGWKEAKSTPPSLPEWMAEEPYKEMRGAVRDLLYGYEVLVENVLDLSHLPYAHHGVSGLNRTMGRPLPFTLTDDWGAAGFLGFGQADVFPSDSLSLEFSAPSRVTYARWFHRVITIAGKPTRFLANVFVTPVAPNRSRIIIQTGVNREIMPGWIPRLPDFMAHLDQQDILDGDAFFLHAQEKAFQRRGENLEPWSRLLFMPTTSDRIVTAYRQWLATYGGNAVTFPEGVEVPLSTFCLPKEQILDRFHGHTQHCTACSEALNRFRMVARFAKSISFALVLATSLSFGRPLTQYGLVGGAVVLLLTALWLEKYSELFIYRGWDHAKR